MGSSDSKIKAGLKDKPLTVVVGGGFSGITLARELEKYCNVLLIEKKNFLFQNIAALRAAIVPIFEETTTVPYDRSLKFGYILMNTTVTSLTSTTVTFKKENIDKQYTIKFNYLALATGSSYGFPMKTPYTNYSDVYTHFKSLQQTIKKNDNILIVGGGPTGVEFVGEICSEYKEKRVVLVHSRDRLLSNFTNKKLSQEVLDKIKKFKNAEVILNDRINFDDFKQENKNNENNEENEEKKYNEKPKIDNGYIANKKKLIKTKSGKEIKDIDLVFFCTGPKINKGLYKDTVIEKILTNEGRIKVKNTLQIDLKDETKDDNWNNVFVMGDVAEHSAKLGYIAAEQAKQVAKSIRRMMNGNTPNVVGKGPEACMVPLGPNEGASLLPLFGGIVKGSKITSMIKGKDLFNDKFWKDTGYADGVEPVPKNYPIKLDGDGLKEKVAQFTPFFKDCENEDLQKLFA